MSLWAKGALVLLGIAVAAFAVDRVFLFLESRGWMYWRRTNRPPADAVSSAVLELQSFVDPKVRHVIEERAEEKGARDDSGDPPEPGAKRA